MGSVRELKLSSNYITRLGQLALSEAVDMVYDMSGKVGAGLFCPSQSGDCIWGSARWADGDVG
jgi:hypothetical protein